MFCNTPYCAILCGSSVASALELKDELWGGKWNWIDWSLTTTGAVIGYSIRIGISILIKF